MPSFNIDYNFTDHPKTLRLIGRLGPGADAIPVRLWSFTAKFFGDDGFIKSYTLPELEASLRWWGEPGKCAEALVDLGFVHANEKGIQVHDWADHQAHIRAYRKKAEEMTKARLRLEKTEKGNKSTPKAKVEDYPSELGQSTSQVNSSSSSSAGHYSAGQGNTIPNTRGEFFNRQIHAKQNETAKALVQRYLDSVKPSHKSTASTAEITLGQLLLDDPTLDVASIERGIDAYAREVQESPRDRRASPKTFFQEERWRSYSGIDAHPRAKTQEEWAEIARKELEDAERLAS
jgi:hypothetical protein